MDIESFVSLKTSSELKNLSNEIMNVITLLSNNKKVFKNMNNKGNQLLKNPKIQLLKDKIENKVNLILNKLSELNIYNLLVEFVETIGKINEDEFNYVQKAFYQKMQSDITFVKIYINFYNLITQVYISNFNYSNKFMINILEAKFLNDYNDIDYIEEYKFLMDYVDNNNPILTENKRVNHLTIIKNMIYSGILTQNLENIITEQLLEQKKYFVDIYYWMQNKTIDAKIKSQIKNIILNNTLPLREKVLLDNLILDNKNTEVKYDLKKPLKKEVPNNNPTLDLKEVPKVESIWHLKGMLQNNSTIILKEDVKEELKEDVKEDVKEYVIEDVIEEVKEDVKEEIKDEVIEHSKTQINEQNINTDTLAIESENIIEEYLYMESINEVKSFVDNRCKDAVSKNKFCQYLFNKYFESYNDISSKILEFIKNLIKKQVLFKSNLSRGLLLLYNNWKDLVDDYNNPTIKLKELLICLKKLGITKNLESLLKTHKIVYE